MQVMVHNELQADAQVDLLNAGGDVSTVLRRNRFNTDLMRPWMDRYGRSWVTFNSGRVDQQGKPIYMRRLVNNAVATLRKDEWKLLDSAVIRTAQNRLRVVADMRGAGLQYVIGNGLAKTQLDYEDLSDINEASISMDGIRRGSSDRVHYDLKSLPLPIVHHDFALPSRQVLVSQNGSTPIDTTWAELAGRKVAEKIEDLTLGEVASYKYAGGYVYGLTTFPNRLTASLTAPTGANNATVVSEVLAMRQQLYDNNFYGPFMLYNSPTYDQYMDTDYSTAKGDNTLRDRLRAIEGITDVRTSDRLSNTTLLMVQQTPDVARMVIGLDVTTVQWQSHGGFQENFKVMAIIVPQIRADQANQCGVCHGSV